MRPEAVILRGGGRRLTAVILRGADRRSRLNPPDFLFAELGEFCISGLRDCARNDGFGGFEPPRSCHSARSRQA